VSESARQRWPLPEFPEWDPSVDCPSRQSQDVQRGNDAPPGHGAIAASAHAPRSSRLEEMSNGARAQPGTAVCACVRLRASDCALSPADLKDARVNAEEGDVKCAPAKVKHEHRSRVECAVEAVGKRRGRWLVEDAAGSRRAG
jgi:hypothetical protein